MRTGEKEPDLAKPSPGSEGSRHYLGARVPLLRRKPVVSRELLPLDDRGPKEHSQTVLR